MRGEGQSLLLLPALSSISTRTELRGLAVKLAQHYQAMLRDFVRDVVPEVTGIVACGHSAGYALALAALSEAVPGSPWRPPLGAGPCPRLWVSDGGFRLYFAGWCGRRCWVRGCIPSMPTQLLAGFD
ncbi:MAG: hypothetical protein EA342_16055 [Leptolyngbya sp. LCM1.Bin17]|nr:MAG: hypothetical protein EA342_16055 [Leptolyngbya sp. LCM1.Bin17]